MVENKKIKISGIAVKEGTSLNKRKYVAKELHTFASTLIGKPILKDHITDTNSVIGKITNAKSIENGKTITYEGWIKDDNTGILEKIKDGRISEVSIGAVAGKLVKESEDSDIVIPREMKALELSTTPTPGNEGTSLNISTEESTNSDFSEDDIKSMIESYNIEEKKKVAKEAEHDMKDEEKEMDECPECKKMVPKEEMNSHMKKEHPNKMEMEKMMSEDEMRNQMKQEHPDWSDEDIENEIKKMKKMGKIEMPKEKLLKIKLTKEQQEIYNQLLQKRKLTNEHLDIIRELLTNEECPECKKMMSKEELGSHMGKEHSDKMISDDELHQFMKNLNIMNHEEMSRKEMMDIIQGCIEGEYEMENTTKNLQIAEGWVTIAGRKILIGDDESNTDGKPSFSTLPKGKDLEKEFKKSVANTRQASKAFDIKNKSLKKSLPASAYQEYKFRALLNQK